MALRAWRTLLIHQGFEKSPREPVAFPRLKLLIIFPAHLHIFRISFRSRRETPMQDFIYAATKETSYYFQLYKRI